MVNVRNFTGSRAPQSAVVGGSAALSVMISIRSSPTGSRRRMIKAGGNTFAFALKKASRHRSPYQPFEPEIDNSTPAHARFVAGRSMRDVGFRWKRPGRGPRPGTGVPNADDVQTAKNGPNVPASSSPPRSWRVDRPSHAFRRGWGPGAMGHERGQLLGNLRVSAVEPPEKLLHDQGRLGAGSGHHLRRLLQRNLMPSRFFRRCRCTGVPQVVHLRNGGGRRIGEGAIVSRRRRLVQLERSRQQWQRKFEFVYGGAAEGRSFASSAPVTTAIWTRTICAMWCMVLPPAPRRCTLRRRVRALTLTDTSVVCGWVAGLSLQDLFQPRKAEESAKVSAHG